MVTDNTKSALRLYNQHLHTLSKMLRLSIPLTSYVARHSWATTAKDEGVAISVISESLGHTSEKVTHVYLASFDNNAMSKANKKVIATIQSKQKEKALKARICKSIPICIGVTFIIPILFSYLQGNGYQYSLTYKVRGGILFGE